MEELDVFFGELTQARASVYARLPRALADADLTLHGTVRGPRCLHAQTLPATFSLVDLGPGPTVLARAVVTEPTYWVPELPAIYDVTVHLQRGDDVLATARREIGLRPLGVRGGRLVLAGKNWVLRGVCRSSTTAALARQWHDEAAALVSDGVDDEALAEASQWGALAVVKLDGSASTFAADVRRLAKHSGAAIVVVRGQLPAAFERSSVAPNLLLGYLFTAAGDRQIPAWADLVVVDASDREQLAAGGKGTELPVIAMRKLSEALDLSAARAECDRLQRDLAKLGQFAGYIV